MTVVMFYRSLSGLEAKNSSVTLSKLTLYVALGPNYDFGLRGDHNADVYSLYLLPRTLKFGLGIDFGPQSWKIDLKILSDQQKCHN